MKKLTLDSLNVQTFATAAVPAGRGTVQAHARTQGCGGSPGGPTQLLCTYSVQECGDTQYFDCTLGCTVETNCYCL